MPRKYTIDPKALSEDAWFELTLNASIVPPDMCEREDAKPLERSSFQIMGALDELNAATRHIERQLSNLRKLKAYLTALIEDPEPKERK